MDHGDCYLKVEETSSPMTTATKFQGDSLSLDRLPRAEILKTAEGTYRIIHSFDPKDELSKLFPVNNNVQIDGFEGNLIFKTGKDIYPSATYWCRSKLPIIISYDTPLVKENMQMTVVFNSNLGRLGVNLVTTKEGKTRSDIFWMDRGKDQKLQEAVHPLPFTDIDLHNQFDKKFRLPVPNSKIDDVFDVEFAAVHGSPKVARFLIQGHFCPIIGVSLKDNS